MSGRDPFKPSDYQLLHDLRSINELLAERDAVQRARRSATSVTDSAMADRSYRLLTDEIVFRREHGNYVSRATMLRNALRQTRDNRRMAV